LTTTPALRATPPQEGNNPPIADHCVTDAYGVSFLHYKLPGAAQYRFRLKKYLADYFRRALYFFDKAGYLTGQETTFFRIPFYRPQPKRPRAQRFEVFIADIPVIFRL
jgi:hypothetical protein